MFTGEFTAAPTLFSAGPSEASSLELDTTLTGGGDIGSSVLGDSSIPMALFPPGAPKTGSEELTSIALVGRVVSRHLSAHPSG